MPISCEQILRLEPTFDGSFTKDKNKVQCHDKLTTVLNALGFFCIGVVGNCYTFERDPWESQITIKAN